MVAYVADEERIAKLAQKYEPKIVRLLEMIGDACEEQGFLVEGPYEKHEKEFAWGIDVHPGSAGPSEGATLHEAATASIMDYVDIVIHLAISEYRDGSEGGMSFMLDTAHYNGDIIGGFAPFNFTDQVWVPRDDRDDVEDRWHVFVEGVDPNAIVASIQDYYRRKKR